MGPGSRRMIETIYGRNPRCQTAPKLEIVKSL